MGWLYITASLTCVVVVSLSIPLLGLGLVAEDPPASSSFASVENSLVELTTVDYRAWQMFRVMSKIAALKGALSS